MINSIGFLQFINEYIIKQLRIQFYLALKTNSNEESRTNLMLMDYAGMYIKHTRINS